DDDNTAGPWDGSSEYPFLFIQHGIDDAADNDTIIVRSGIYLGLRNRDLDFHGKAITLRSESGAAVTIINCQGSEADPHRGFLFISNELRNSVVDGFTITNGVAQDGGGIACYKSHPTIINCRIISNTATANGGGIHCNISDAVIRNCQIISNTSTSNGGGVYCEASHTKIAGCRLEGNDAEYGGGLYIKQLAPTINQCDIIDNSAVYGGGFFSELGDPNVLDCTLRDNSASWGGAVGSAAGRPAFANCYLSNNTAAVEGGGIYANGGLPNIINCEICQNAAVDHGGAIFFERFVVATFTNCTINNNTAGAQGGGINYQNSLGTLSNCTIKHNAAAYGGGLYLYQSSPEFVSCTIGNNLTSNNAGGIFCWDNSNPDINNCIISNNSTAGNGGAFFCWDHSSPVLNNCTITGNSAIGFGGGIFCWDDSNLTITNCILWDDEPQEVDVMLANPILNYCDIEGGWSGSGSNNINADPNFENACQGNFRLLPVSPCIDAGTSDATPAEDMEGRPRHDDPATTNTGGGAKPYYDIGAHEFKWIYVNRATGDDTWDGLLPERRGKHGPKLTIQEGLNVANDGDRVSVNRGIYTGSRNRELDFGGKAIRLISEHGPENTTIDCEGAGRGFYFHSGEGIKALVDSFTIRNGDADYGGGIRCSASSPSITNCVIENCSAGVYGGGVYCHESSPMISYCTIQDNSAVVNAGGIYCYSFSSPTISHCIINGNSAYAGGGVQCHGSSNPMIANCIISGNIINDKGGGIYCYHYSCPSIFNTIITANHANSGAGVCCYFESNPQITNCTIAANAASLSAGGLLCIESSDPNLTNCIIWDNNPQEVDTSNSTPSLNYCDIKDGWSGVGAGNIKFDPLFMDPNGFDGILGTLDDNFHLKNYSPCINRGDPAGDYSNQKDIDGELRIRYSYIDIGADEVYPVAGDFEPDEDVDVADLSTLAGYWLDTPCSGPQWCGKTDINHDGMVNLGDYAIFAFYWMIGK
ncbi:MAG: hypothetical protein AMJ79_08870, partial [Phycisphaerae bacterium SM23_30]